jgi:hypothetical protein
MKTCDFHPRGKQVRAKWSVFVCQTNATTWLQVDVCSTHLARGIEEGIGNKQRYTVEVKAI